MAVRDKIMLPKKKKIMFFCPHIDDDTFSSGALLVTLAKNNEIISIYLTSGPRGVSKNVPFGEKIRIRKSEGTKACGVLGIRPVFLSLDKPILKNNRKSVDVILKLLNDEKPDIIFLPPPNDAHPTHKKVNQIVSEAAKCAGIRERWFYETWMPLAKPNFIFFFNDNLMKMKIKAMKQHKSQIERTDFITAIVALNEFRGTTGKKLLGGFGKLYQSGKNYGEAFLIDKFN